MIHPHHLEKINSVKKLLLTYKNILIQMHNKGYVEKIDGISLPVRFSVHSKEFVIDRNDKNYKHGVNLKLINEAYKENQNLIKGSKYLLNHLNQDNFINFSNSINLKKNENRTLLFKYINHKTNIIDYKKEGLIFFGLYQKKEDSSYIAIDNSNKFLNNFSNNFSFVLKNNAGKIKENSYDFFNTMIESIKNSKFECFVENDLISLELDDFIKSNNYFNKEHKLQKRKIKDTSINLYRNLVNKKISINNNQFNLFKNGILATHLNLIVGNYIKKKLEISGEGIIINSGVFEKKNIKLVGSFILEKREVADKKVSNSYQPLLPIKF